MLCAIYVVDNSGTGVTTILMNRKIDKACKNILHFRGDKEWIGIRGICPFYMQYRTVGLRCVGLFVFSWSLTGLMSCAMVSMCGNSMKKKPRRYTHTLPYDLY